MTAGRNDPCPCGSGQKYKKCCMNKKRVLSAKVITTPSKTSSLAGRIKPALPKPVEPGFQMTDRDYRVQ